MKFLDGCLAGVIVVGALAALAHFLYAVTRDAVGWFL